MISYLKGEITHKNPAYILVETAGVGYHVNITLNTYAQIESLSHVKILTWLQVREDAHVLYGFADEAERSLFLLLISVSGVGTNTARLLLSGMTPDELKSSIISENMAAFSRVKGIGPKTARRLIVELKDKVVKETGEAPQVALLPKDDTMREEALSALVALGFARANVQKVLNAILKEQPGPGSVEALIKTALRQLS